jgi:hypothetical protein
MKPSRTPSKLSDSVHRQLNMYALVASAAEVSVLALAQPAEARIVYTPAHVVIEPNRPYGVDQNFKIFNDCRTGSGGRSLDLNIGVYNSNAVMGTRTVTGGISVFRLPAGFLVGPGQHWYSGGVMASYSAGRFGGDWQNGPKAVKGYLGLMFRIKSDIHYGWARLTVDGGSGPCFAVTLTGYAYETIVNKPIITGKTKGSDVITVQPASLGHLAAGASAIPTWRSGK